MFDFDVKKIVKTYNGKENEFLKNLQKEFNLDYQSVAPNGRWATFYKTIISAAKFMNDFKDEDAFLKFVNSYYKNIKKVSDLPAKITDKIYEFSFDQSCVFLCNLGFTDYVEPNYSLLSAYGYITNGESDKNKLKKFIKMSRDSGVSGYTFAKVLDLISTGVFYYDDIKLNHLGDVFSKRASEISSF